MRTSMAMKLLSSSSGLPGKPAREVCPLRANRPPPPIIPCATSTLGPGGGRSLRATAGNDTDLLLGDLTIHDAERPEPGAVLLAGRNQHVVRLRFAGQRNVRPGRVRL